MLALRPGVGNEENFVRVVDEIQRPEGYRLVGAFEESGAGHAAAVAGFRLAHSLHRGRHLYVDDLSTLESARRRGFGRALMDWLVVEAGRLACTRLDLDSGLGPHRSDAHRLYFNSGLVIDAHHFARGLDA